MAELVKAVLLGVTLLGLGLQGAAAGKKRYDGYVAPSPAGSAPPRRVAPSPRGGCPTPSRWNEWRRYPLTPLKNLRVACVNICQCVT